MTTITANQRTINIINKAIENGFTFDVNDTIQDALIVAEEYLIENTEAIEIECEVDSLGRNGQRVDWSDGKGFDYWCQGEIVDFSAHYFDSPDTKVFHTTVVDSQAQVVKLYYLVGLTSHNTF